MTRELSVMFVIDVEEEYLVKVGDGRRKQMDRVTRSDGRDREWQESQGNSILAVCACVGCEFVYIVTAGVLFESV